MLTIKELTVKNFMSVGNQVQAIDFSNKSLVLVIGENMDLGGDDAGARNGTGKTTIINALSYVFFGEALTNIRRDNLVNKTNEKGMVVSAKFIKNGVTYTIERREQGNTIRDKQVDGHDPCHVQEHNCTEHIHPAIPLY